MATSPCQVTITVDVIVHDPETLLAYARVNARRWGRPADAFDHDDRETISDAAYETFVGNAVDPLDVGCEISSYYHEAGAVPPQNQGR